MVVGEDRPLPGRPLGEVSPVGAQVATGGVRRVVEVLGVGHAVTVAVARPTVAHVDGQELERADGVVPRRVAVQRGRGAGGADRRHRSAAVQRRPDDRLRRASVREQRPATEGAVHRLDLADPGEGGPAEPAARLLVAEPQRGGRVGADRRGREPGGRGRALDPGRVDHRQARTARARRSWPRRSARSTPAAPRRTRGSGSGSRSTDSSATVSPAAVPSTASQAATTTAAREPLIVAGDVAAAGTAG